MARRRCWPSPDKRDCVVGSGCGAGRPPSQIASAKNRRDCRPSARTALRRPSHTNRTAQPPPPRSAVSDALPPPCTPPPAAGQPGRRRVRRRRPPCAAPNRAASARGPRPPAWRPPAGWTGTRVRLLLLLVMGVVAAPLRHHRPPRRAASSSPLPTAAAAARGTSWTCPTTIPPMTATCLAGAGLCGELGCLRRRGQAWEGAESAHGTIRPHDPLIHKKNKQTAPSSAP
jgi:hypothetical protein